MVLITTPGTTYAEATKPWQGLVDVVEVTALPLTGQPADALLVRPDGYIAWVSPNGGDLTTTLGSWLIPAGVTQLA